MATKPKNEVALKQAGEMAPFAAEAVPSYLKDGPARGNEDVKQSDMVLPRLELVQSQSPIKEIDGNEEVRDGQLFNSVTQEVYGDLVYFVPVYYRTEYLIWKHQDAGGGFFGSFPSADEARLKFKELIEEDPSLAGKTKDGKDVLEVVDTPVHYGLRITPEGTIEQIVISMAKSKAKVSRKWNAMVQITGGDRFARVYKISSFGDENKQGKKFKNYVVQPAGFPPEAVYLQAEKIYETFRSGEMRVAHETVLDDDNDRPVPDSGRGEI